MCPSGISTIGTSRIGSARVMEPGKPEENTKWTHRGRNLRGHFMLMRMPPPGGSKSDMIVRTAIANAQKRYSIT